LFGVDISDILLIAIVYFFGMASSYAYWVRKKNKKINLQISNKDVMIKKVISDNDIRKNVIDELSRQKLVFSEKENRWIRLRQIN